MRKMFEALSHILRRGEDAVLVTITASSGSVPRGTGAHMLVAKKGRVWGSIGGGPVERRAELEAMEVLCEKSSAAGFFALRQSRVADLGMVCGGEVSVCFHLMSGASALETAEKALTALDEGARCWLVGTLRVGAGLALYDAKSGTAGAELPGEIVHALAEKPVLTEVEGALWYAEPLVRSGTVYIFGGGHVAQALVPALAAVEFRCVVLEDRPEFCDPGLFPGAAEVRLVDMERLEETLAVSGEDYICVMTRGHAKDLLCEAFALTTPARYIGVIGSRKKTAWTNQALKEKSFTDIDLKRITTPIGLAIQAETPAEIAVSIAAQLIQVRAAGREKHAH